MFVLTGIYSENEAENESKQDYDTATIEYIDPETGSFEYSGAIRFLRAYEREAGYVVDVAKLRDVEPRWQILHYP